MTSAPPKTTANTRPSESPLAAPSSSALTSAILTPSPSGSVSIHTRMPSAVDWLRLYTFSIPGGSLSGSSDPHEEHVEHDPPEHSLI